jgi:hypothetical protein
MTLSTTIHRRLIAGLVLVAASTAGASPAALASHGDLGAKEALNQIRHIEPRPASSAGSAMPDAIDRYLRNHARPATTVTCDAVCRYLRNHTAHG